MNNLTNLIWPLNKISFFTNRGQDAYLDKNSSTLKVVGIKLGKELVGVAAVAGLTHLLFYQFCQEGSLCRDYEQANYCGSVTSPVLEELIVRGLIQHSVLVGQLAFNHLYNSIFKNWRPLNHNSSTQKVIRISTSALASSLVHSTFSTHPIILFTAQYTYGKLTDDTGSLIPTLFIHSMHNLFFHVKQFEIRMYPHSYSTLLAQIVDIGCLWSAFFHGKAIFSLEEWKKLLHNQPTQASSEQEKAQVEEIKAD
jgi:hypothetical protein